MEVGKLCEGEEVEGFPRDTPRSLLFELKGAGRRGLRRTDGCFRFTAELRAVLEPGKTKNKRGREFPLTAELRTLLEAQVVDFLVTSRRTVDERDRLVERGPAGAGVTHRRVLVPDRHAAEEDEPVRG